MFLSLKHPLQPRRFALALLFALILFPLIAAFLVAGTAVLLVPLVAFLFWLSGRILYANFLGNFILVTDLNYPRIHRIGEDLKSAIGYDKPVSIFVYEQGNFNAYLMKFFFYRRAVFLNSELLEAGVTDDELSWLIGRFIGYLRARRQAGFWGWTIRAAQYLLVFNLFLLPYERSLVYTGDRIALAVIHGNISSACSAMQKLFVGRQLGYSVNPNGLIDQHRQVKGSFFAFMARLCIAFPHMTARYVDLIGCTKQRYPEQFTRFEAENPGLPADLENLVALPHAAVSGGRDPVWASLLGAVLVLGLLSLLTAKVIVPELSNIGTSVKNSIPQTPTRDSANSSVSSEGQPSTVSSVDSEQKPYTSSTGRFSVLFPGVPTQSSQRVDLPNNDSASLYLFEFNNKGMSYVVMYIDYPAKYVAGVPQALLEHVRDGSIESLKATLKSDEPIDLKGVPGRAFTFVGKDGSTGSARYFLDGQRLYQVLVAVNSDASSTLAENFLDSFRIL
jgi:hypothetical protein